MIGKILGISFIIVSCLHFYLLNSVELKSNHSLKKIKKDEVNFIKLKNYQIKKLPTVEPKKIEPKMVEPIKEVKKEPKKTPKFKKIVKKVIKPKKIKKIEKKVIAKVEKTKETPKPKEVQKEIVEPKVKPKIVQNTPNISNIKKEIVKKSVSKEENIKLEKIKAIYALALRKKIEEYKNYPRVARKLGQEGSVEVKFTILDNGVIKDIKILKPSNYDRLNSATIKTLKEINRFKPIPKELKLTQWEFILPIEFKLN